MDTGEVRDVRLSLCFTNFGTRDMIVHSSRNQNATEPIISYDSFYLKFVTDSVRRLLNATSSSPSPSERGILSMRGPKSWRHAEGEHNPYANGPAGIEESVLGNLTSTIRPGQEWAANNFTIMLCQYCAPNINQDNASFVNQQLSQIYSDALNATDHPSIALPALLTIVYTSAYYDILPQFTLSGLTQIVSFVETLIPVSIVPLIAVVLIVSLHLLLLVVIIVMFVHSGTLSLLGSVWPAIAQLLQAEDIHRWAVSDTVINIRDKEVLAKIKTEGSDVVHYRLHARRVYQDDDFGSGWVTKDLR